ncbi:MAG TPA: sulfatase-modifying factor protein [Rhizobiales bacterium]|nr:sulfatase-modifying factor protein [Hyphomicrobiales bacterium]
MIALIDNIEDQLQPIPAGTILMQDNRIKKSWSATIAPFLIGQFQVTSSLFQEIMGPTDSDFSGDTVPVTSVSWLEAVEFCNQLSKMANLQACYIFSADQQDAKLILDSNGYRLPSEAEWEYACRAGTHGPRYGALDEIAWYKINSNEHPQPVGTKQPNGWGLYDMLGNVWEWCSDVYDPETYGAYRIFRGGGWADEARGCLATNRRRSHPTFSIDDLGFRLARSL